MMIRNDWNLEELRKLYELPLMELISKAHAVHCAYHDVGKVQVCSIISIKTGGCPEDCKYCAQSARYITAIKAEPMMSVEEVLRRAKLAKSQGATRVCLVAAWRSVRNSKQFEDALQMTREVAGLGVEVCCCLGMVDEAQAERLKEAGAYAYSHNLDTSERFYPKIITTRTYQDRLNTLKAIRKAQITVCCGAILGMGEEVEDRLELLRTLSSQRPHPESVPINRLSAIAGTPLEKQPTVSIWEMLRIIAIARITMPKTMVRLSAGRAEMSFEQQALCFFAGVNSIHMGEKLLTVGNSPVDRDREMFQLLGLR
ncbi:MAG: biotin synthase BioB [Verrucomicrobia bacterium]|nr:biotin synthase BioB [Verrucomicrobiota bacterium]